MVSNGVFERPVVVVRLRVVRRAGDSCQIEHDGALVLELLGLGGGEVEQAILGDRATDGPAVLLLRGRRILPKGVALGQSRFRFT